MLGFALAAVVAATTGCAGRAAEGPALPVPTATGAGGAVTAAAVRVVDGDTIVVRLPDGSEERVRYIGIDAPEAPREGDPGEPLSEQATARNGELLAVGTVRLEFDRDLRDGFGRLLAYVSAGGAFVNGELVRQGLAEARSYPPNTARDAELAEAEREARTAGRGIWGLEAE